VFLLFFGATNLQGAAKKILFLDGFDILLEKRLSGAAEGLIRKMSAQGI
jgi:hypothetical protein